MQPWLVRGAAMGATYAAAETALAEIQVYHPTSGSVVSPIALALLVGASGLWGGVDGWLRKPNRGMGWFYAGLLGGVVAGLLSVAARAIFVDQTGIWALAGALTGDAAFVALLIMVPAGLGLGIGGRLQPPTPRVRAGGPEQTGPIADGPITGELVARKPAPRAPGKRALRRSRATGQVRGAGR